MKVIDNFKDDKYLFLMNDYPCSIIFEQEIYPSIEHAYQAAKTFDVYARDLIKNAKSVGAARRLGRNVPLQLNWDNNRVAVMKGFLDQKFSGSDELRVKLLNTGDAELVAGGDSFWGNTGYHGKNQLGKLLMELRSSLNEEALAIISLAKNEYLKYFGWDRRPDGDNIFGECWVLPPNVDCLYDVDSAVAVQTKLSTSVVRQ